MDSLHQSVFFSGRGGGCDGKGEDPYLPPHERLLERSLPVPRGTIAVAGFPIGIDYHCHDDQYHCIDIVVTVYIIFIIIRYDIMIVMMVLLGMMMLRMLMMT